MATDRTETTIIVVLAALQADAELAAITADPVGGAGTFDPGTPLRVAGDASNATVAYWTMWNMTSGQQSAFATSLGGPMNIIKLGQNVDTSRDRWMFDAKEGQWTSNAVLAALGFAVPIPPEI